MDCIVYTDYVYPAVVSLLADISLSFQKSFWFVFLSFLLFHIFFSSFLSFFLFFKISGLLALSYPLVSLPD